MIAKDGRYMPVMAAIQPLEFRWGIISTGQITSAFVKVRSQILQNPTLGKQSIDVHGV